MTKPRFRGTGFRRRIHTENIDRICEMSPIFKAEDDLCERFGPRRSYKVRGGILVYRIMRMIPDVYLTGSQDSAKENRTTKIQSMMAIETTMEGRTNLWPCRMTRVTKFRIIRRHF
jgi:hypothetical protein